MEYTEIFSNKFISLVKEKFNTIGEVKTVKFVRVETGMSLIAAKKLVDACKE